MRALTVILCFSFALTYGSVGEVHAQEKESTQPVVLLELFTSEGCSSCPPADALLSELGNKSMMNGARLVPLAFHVDYWNGLGWTDPYSSPEWTQRQRNYASALNARSLYTPEIVIQGSWECVGSSRARVQEYIREASKRAKGSFARLQLAGVESNKTGYTVRIVTSGLENLSGPSYLLMVAWYESALISHVARGENSGLTLKHDFVVRQLDVAAKLYPDQKNNSVEAKWDPLNEKMGPKGVAVFLQREDTLEVIVAAQTSLRE